MQLNEYHSESADPGTIAHDFIRRWESGQRYVALSDLISQLEDYRVSTGVEEWKKSAKQVRETVGAITGQDPLSGRCVEKPRGYAGDARTLDLIYNHHSAAPEVLAASAEGQSVFSVTNNRRASTAVRTRRQILADAIDHTCTTRHRARVLSLACGHLREAELSRAVQSGGTGAFYALDQDGESLNEISRCYGKLGTTPVMLGVRELLSGVRPAEDLDLAYSAGLYDYLPDEVAARTNKCLFDMLAPGGRMIVANFSPDLPDIGYMESCMDWWLIYRDEKQMADLMRLIDPASIADVHVWKDDFGKVVYLEAIKA